MTQPKARRGRPPSLTREQIAKTVLDVGFANLTFAAVRDRLGVGETTLYRYAPDRDELVRMGLEYAYSGIEVPSFEGPWREVLTAHALNTTALRNTRAQQPRWHVASFRPLLHTFSKSFV